MDKPAIRTRGLTKRFGTTTALVDLDLEVDQGEVFGLLGHNGAGKTTTVSILTSLLDASSGSAEVNGHDVALSSLDVRRSIGYLPENVQFYDALTLHENLAFFARLSGIGEPANRIQEVLHFLDFEGHETQRLSTFSKGMRQRVGIAQAILHQPSVLFLDEPTSGLDPTGVRMLRAIVTRGLQPGPAGGLRLLAVRRVTLGGTLVIRPFGIFVSVVCCSCLHDELQPMREG
jgi:ABC-type multidrug transport system, ATPase component